MTTKRVRPSFELIAAKAAAIAAVATLAGLATSAQAAYFVRPVIGAGASTIDGIQVNGATQSSQNFTSDLQAHVDLGAGTIKTYLNGTGPGNYYQAAGIMGDRLTFDGAEGTELTFSFDFDGTIFSTEWDSNLNSTLQMGVFANLFVFEAGTGATYENFSSHSGALVAQSIFIPYTNPVDGLNEDFFRTLSGVVSVNGVNSFDVFAGLSTFVAFNDNPATVTLDFMNTATFGIKGAQGVSYTSDSGVFLGGAIGSAVPEPATWAIMILGFGTAGAALRRRRVEGALAA
jgi:hypothetical protein